MEHKMKFFLTLSLISVVLDLSVSAGILYPRASPTRHVLSLDGLWKFSLSDNGTFSNSESLTGIKGDKDLHLMPVPSSYNDVLTTLDGRDHLGPVKYERNFYVPEEWTKKNDSRVWLRFGSVCYSAKVYINEKLAMSHEIGHLPFQGEITSFLVEDKNVITVIVDNTLTATTVPQGSNRTLPGGRVAQTYAYDFFNYAGIDRSVFLYKTSSIYIDDITISTTVNDTIGVVHWTINNGGTDTRVSDQRANYVIFNITVLNKERHTVAEMVHQTGSFNLIYSDSLDINDANLWWPYLMHEDPGYLYTLRVELVLANNTLVDVYEHPFGIRQLTWNNDTFQINGKPIYFRGMGRHEDSDIRGKGVDLSQIVRDHNLLKWLGVNSYRTSHYPYAEEIMDLADSIGIMIIDECPIVNTDNYGDELLENHKRSLTELHQRDKNRPGVVIWSIANEPNTKASASKNYYSHVAAHIKSLDNTRPISLAMYYDANDDHAGEYLDIICFNKYEGWYLYTGDTGVIIQNILNNAQAWRDKYNKTVLVTEYGADSLEGLHILPAYIWSEEFHIDVMSKYFEAFDQLRKKGWFIGEMIWVYADFRTASDTRRVGGNKKGVFTRERQPKAAAHFLRNRYWSLANRLNNATRPTDLERYVIRSRSDYDQF